MNIVSRLPLSLTFLALSATSLLAQNLTNLLEEKESEAKGAFSYESEVRTGRNRVDLSLAPRIKIPRWGKKESVGFSVNADFRMICGQYDLKATFQHLLGKQAREEFLESLPQLLVQELIGSGMDILCQTEPTLCNLIQNYSISADLKASYYKDLCSTIDNALLDARKKNYASAVEACLKKKKDQGYTLDQAMEACQMSQAQITGFRGEVVDELDLGSSLRDILGEMGLSPGAHELVERLSEDTKVSSGSMSSQVNSQVFVKTYKDLQRKYADCLNALIEKVRRGYKIAPEELLVCVPVGAPRITEDEIRTFALLSGQERDDAIGSLASSLAFFDLTRQMHEIERALEALKDAPTVNEAKRAMLEGKLERIKSERSRLPEYYKAQGLVMQSLSSVKSLAHREYTGRVSQIRSRRDLASKKSALCNRVTSYGSIPRSCKNSTPTASGSGTTTGAGPGQTGVEYSFGSVGGGR